MQNAQIMADLPQSGKFGAFFGGEWRVVGAVFVIGRLGERCGAAGTFGRPLGLLKQARIVRIQWPLLGLRRAAIIKIRPAGATSGRPHRRGTVMAVWRPYKHRVAVWINRVVKAWRTVKAYKTSNGARTLVRVARPEPKT